MPLSHIFRRPTVVAFAVTLFAPALLSSQPRNVVIEVEGNETSVAIDPTDTRRIVAGANLAYVLVSTDRGSTWGVGELTSPLGVWGDPCVVFDDSGSVYFAHLSNPPSGAWIDRIVAQRSTDFGFTWSDGGGIHTIPGKEQDKEWLAIDFTGSRRSGAIHATWTEFDNYGSGRPEDRSRILYARSTDRASTWTPAVRVSEAEGNCRDSDSTTEGAVPAVGPDGEVYLAWSDIRGIIFDASTDGGDTWGTDRVIATQPGGWDYHIPGLIRCNGLPVTSCDISGGQHRGNVYVSWSDQRNGGDDTDIWFIRSTDRGATWSQAARVNGDSTRTHQFMSWMTVDRTTGFIYILYYDRRRFTDLRTDVVLARSTDGGTSFTEERVSEQPFVADPGVFLGDYVGIAAHERVVAMMWTRTDGGSSSLVSATMIDSAGPATAVRSVPGTASALSCRAIRGRGREQRTGVRFTLPRPQRVRVDVYDLLGRHLGTATNALYDAGEQLLWWPRSEPAGAVVFRVQAEDGTVGCVGG